MAQSCVDNTLCTTTLGYGGVCSSGVCYAPNCSLFYGNDLRAYPCGQGNPTVEGNGQPGNGSFPAASDCPCPADQTQTLCYSGASPILQWACIGPPPTQSPSPSSSPATTLAPFVCDSTPQSQVTLDQCIACGGFCYSNATTGVSECQGGSDGGVPCQSSPTPTGTPSLIPCTSANQPTCTAPAAATQNCATPQDESGFTWACTPEMADYLAMAFVVVAGGLIYYFRRRARS
jgi:hypothetical protein